jgi:nicotinate-nucleotide adenylyltransferase
MKIGLMGGTFNPIHLGHLIITEFIRINLSLDKVIFIPSGNPPHKDLDEIISAKHRYNMALLAVDSNPHFQISLSEINRRGISYTVDTIREFIENFPNDELFFIIGADSLNELTKWKEFILLFKITNFIAIGRPGISKEDCLNKINELHDKYNVNIDYIDGPLIEISSTDIRQRVSKDKSIKYLVPETIEEYIKVNNLYTLGD